MSKLLLPRGYRSAELLQKRLHTEPEKLWIKRGQQRALRLFHEMSERVPAYKDFLKQHKFDPKSVKTFADFHTIPPINKDNYLRSYPKKSLCWDGEFAHGQWVISSTSGSTGEPFYFPREHSQDWQYAITAELYLRNNFQIQDKSTLYIVAFPMGAWIGGLFTYEALKIVAENGGYDLSIITPGIHKQEVINAVKQLGASFDQIIIGAYAPFLKDILNDGSRQGINWEDHEVGFVFSAEAFTEKFRDYVLDTTKTKKEFTSTLNHYGTVDLGTMSHETPESVLIRRTLVQESSLHTLLPESLRQPTLTQFNPELFYFEEENHSLFCTAFSGLPLVRYDLKDYGGVMTRADVHTQLAKNGINVDEHLKSHQLDTTTWNLPFVYVYERNDFSVSYYAFLLYPDMIRRALQDDSLAASITGKFTMMADYDNEGRQKLRIHIELHHGQKSSDDLMKEVTTRLHDRLIEESSEYREVAKMIGDDVLPDVIFWPYEDATYFKSGVKQKWVVKNEQ